MVLDTPRIGSYSLGRILRPAALFCALLACGIAEAKNDRNCTKRERAAADRLLKIGKANQQQLLTRHMPWGAPVSASATETTLIHRDYVISHDRDLRVPIWTAHRLDSRGLGKTERVNCFRADPRLATADASDTPDYVEPVYDQGHLTPNNDMSRALYPVINSFLMSNMAPQYCHFNRGVWQIFESVVRLWATDKKRIYVLTGSVLDRDGDGKRDANSSAKRMKSTNGSKRVAIPTHFYKIILHQPKVGPVEALAVLLPHDQTDLSGAAAIAYLTDHIRSVAEIEQLTGLKFFPQLTGEAAAVKQTRAASLWPYKGKPSNSLVNPSCRKTTGMDI